MEAKEKKLGTGSAYPCITIEGNYEDTKTKVYHAGVSKRLLLAGMAMQGLLASCTLIQIDETVIKKAVRYSIMASDELLRQENL